VYMASTRHMNTIHMNPFIEGFMRSLALDIFEMQPATCMGVEYDWFPSVSTEQRTGLLPDQLPSWVQRKKWLPTSFSTQAWSGRRSPLDQIAPRSIIRSPMVAYNTIKVVAASGVFTNSRAPSQRAIRNRRQNA